MTDNLIIGGLSRTSMPSRMMPEDKKNFYQKTEKRYRRQKLIPASKNC